MSRDRGSQWLPGPQRDTRKRADWVPGHSVYWGSVRTPWLSMALAIILDLVALAAIAGGAVIVITGAVGPGIALVLSGLVLLGPLGVWGTIIARRRFWSDR